MLDVMASSSLPDMQKAVIKLKLTAILRIMHECEGMSDDQIRRRLKSIFADIKAELDHIEGDHSAFMDRATAWVSSSMRGGVFALGLTADAMSVAAIAGPAAAAILLASPPEVKMIEGPANSAAPTQE